MRPATHFLLILLGVGLDQSTKALAEAFLSGTHELVIIPHILSFILVHNTGAAYGIFENQFYFLVGISLFILATAFIFKSKWIKTRWSEWAWICLIIGAIGNLIDRLLHGHVIDFMYIHIVPVFNVADVMIDLCILFMIIEAYKDHARNR